MIVWVIAYMYIVIIHPCSNIIHWCKSSPCNSFSVFLSCRDDSCLGNILITTSSPFLHHKTLDISSNWICYIYALKVKYTWSFKILRCTCEWSWQLSRTVYSQDYMKQITYMINKWQTLRFWFNAHCLASFLLSKQWCDLYRFQNFLTCVVCCTPVVH